MAEDLKPLIRVRGSIKQKLTNLEKFVNSINVESEKIPTLSEVEVRYKNNEFLLKDFEEVQLKIETLCEEASLSEHYAEREHFETRYTSVIGFLYEYINNKQKDIVKNQTEKVMGGFTSEMHCHSDPLQGVLVPKSKLPVFKGDYGRWLEFKTTYVSSIHSNTRLTKSQKFQLLRNALEGYAKRLVDKIEFTEDNYEVAWARLCKRYDNKRVLVNNHLKSICNLEVIQKESASHFRKLLDEVSDHLTSLEGLHLTGEVLWEVAIIYIISSKLDKVTYRDWKDFKSKNEFPTLEEFLDFLTNKADLLEAIREKNSEKYSDKQSGQNKQHSQNHLSIANLKCNCCKGPHSIYKCPEFLKLEVPARLEKVTKLQLCPNCLLTNHKKESCKLGGCRVCQEKHNTLLHGKTECNVVNLVSSPENPSTSDTEVKVHSEASILTLGEHEASKTLGIKWMSQADILMYDISPMKSSTAISKRQVLADISQIYDPLGLISPCVILAKIIIQKLWSLKLAWDAPIPNDLVVEWDKFRDIQI
ncbi:hypothetical protein NQ315_014577 [Exocentrus adspersus]|uniref:Uncharacterized protein n=1 Tax=Exocentrus adspersus TaxID=1586481 RepID=A0AAV8VEI9_9CUCU|nr:hypothetical protein NQ315_014577 [Exocentrus adspersus]